MTSATTRPTRTRHDPGDRSSRPGRFSGRIDRQDATPPTMPPRTTTPAVSPLLALAIVAVLLLVHSGCAGLRPTAASRGPASATGGDATWYQREGLFNAFDPAATDLSLTNAYLLELACDAGDRGTFELEKTLRTWGFDQVRDFRHLQTSTYGFVASNDRMVLVTFGGTDVMNLRDLISDADALQQVYDETYCLTPEARVHRGFRDSVNAVIEGVTAEVRRQAAPSSSAAAGTQPASAPAGPKPVWIAGHSRGGAMAALAAAAFTGLRQRDSAAGDAAFPPVAGVYTFGQPRVGNGVFADSLNRSGLRLFRIVNGDDPVSLVPPPSSLPRRGYQHAGTLVHLAPTGAVRRNPDLPDFPKVDAGLGGHYQSAYQSALYRALSNPESIEVPDWRATVPTAEQLRSFPQAR